MIMYIFIDSNYNIQKIYHFTLFLFLFLNYNKTINADYLNYE